MTPNEIKRLQALCAKVEATRGVSDLVALTAANVKLLRKAVHDAISAGNAEPDMVRLAAKMGIL